MRRSTDAAVRSTGHGRVARWVVVEKRGREPTDVIVFWVNAWTARETQYTLCTHLVSRMSYARWRLRIARNSSRSQRTTPAAPTLTLSALLSHIHVSVVHEDTRDTLEACKSTQRWPCCGLSSRTNQLPRRHGTPSGAHAAHSTAAHPAPNDPTSKSQQCTGTTGTQ